MIVMEVSFAIMLQDDFSGSQILDDGHVFSVHGIRLRPLKKPEGFYVFTGLPVSSTLQIDSARYCPASVLIDSPSLTGDRVQTVRLVRRGDIRFADCERLVGNDRPGREVYAFAAHSPPLQLREAEGDRVVLEGFTTKRLLGRCFAAGTGKSRELFVLREQLPDGSYRADPCLRKKHKPGTELMRAYRGICDRTGHFAIPVEPGDPERIGQAEAYDEEKDKWVCLSATAPA